jgi:hypothetical protein
MALPDALFVGAIAQPFEPPRVSLRATAVPFEQPGVKLHATALAREMPPFFQAERVARGGRMGRSCRGGVRHIR